MAGEGRRLYGRTTTSAVLNKYAMTVRQPLGVAGLIIAANTPIANVAWKVFPALICGNTAVLKAAEDTPATAWFFGKLAHEAGLPAGGAQHRAGPGRGSRGTPGGPPRCRRGQLYRLDPGRPTDCRGRRPPPGQGLPGAGRQKPAGGLRRRRPGERRPLGAALGLQQCRSALRGRQSDHHL